MHCAKWHLLSLSPSLSFAHLPKADATVQMRRAVLEAHHLRNPYLVLQVSRENIVEDCLQQLAPKSEVDLKMQLKVKFKGEDGIDEGGLAKEFFQVGQLWWESLCAYVAESHLLCIAIVVVWP